MEGADRAPGSPQPPVNPDCNGSPPGDLNSLLQFQSTVLTSHELAWPRAVCDSSVPAHAPSNRPASTAALLRSCTCTAHSGRHHRGSRRQYEPLTLLVNPTKSPPTLRSSTLSFPPSAAPLPRAIHHPAMRISGISSSLAYARSSVSA